MFGDAGDWNAFAVLPMAPRWYALFGALTNGEVRGDKIQDLELPLRGLPSTLVILRTRT